MRGGEGNKENPMSCFPSGGHTVSLCCVWLTQWLRKWSPRCKTFTVTLCAFSYVTVLHNVINIDIEYGLCVCLGTKTHQGALKHMLWYGKSMPFRIMCLFGWALPHRIQNRCNEQIFSPEELSVHCPRGTVWVKPEGKKGRREESNQCLGKFLLSQS